MAKCFDYAMFAKITWNHKFFCDFVPSKCQKDVPREFQRNLKLWSFYEKFREIKVWNYDFLRENDLAFHANFRFPLEFTLNKIFPVKSTLHIVIYLVNALVSRNFCQKSVRVNFRNFHTVQSALLTYVIVTI